jgi:sulfite exporter TauE/SafE
MNGVALSLPALFLLGLASSPHCALMCAPLTLAGTPRRLLALHGGRLLSYALLGGVAGGFGASLLWQLDRLGIAGPLRWLAAGLLVGLGLLQLRPHPTRPACCPPPLSQRLLALPPLVRGLLWGALPCALLYGVLALAALSGSAAQGSTLALAFGLGTSPLLLAGGGLGAWLQRRLPPNRLRRASALLLVASGLWIGAFTPLTAPLLGSWCYAAAQAYR